ncbi:hypothetical protein ACLOJK_015012 [Asimina triloba]
MDIFGTVAGKNLVHSILGNGQKFGIPGEDISNTRLLNKDLEASIQRLTGQAEQDWERISELLSEVDAFRIERDDAIRKAARAEYRALQLLVESPLPASRVMSPLAHDPSEGSSFGEKALVIREPVGDLN